MVMETNYSLVKCKFKAASVHLFISSIIFCILAYLIAFKWYPFPYFTADGGWQGIRIVALIDIVLGPLLTLVIFNPRKTRHEIRFDLGIIALAQISVLTWGVYTVYNERPAAVIHWSGEFYTMPSKSFKAQNISIEKLNQFSEETPPLIHANLPADPVKLQEILNIVNEKKLAPFEQFQLYHSFKDNKDEIFLQQINIDEIISFNKDMKKELSDFLEKTKSKKDDYIYMPLNARYHNVILIFSREGAIRGTLNAPYKVDSV